MGKGKDEAAQLHVTANVLISTNRAKLRPAIDAVEKVANSQYWSYGYLGGVMMGSTALALGVGSKIPAVRSYLSWIGLGAGFFGGRKCHQVHVDHLKGKVVEAIDQNIAEMGEMDKKFKPQGVMEYSEELRTLTRMRNEIRPPKTGEFSVKEQQRLANMTIDERVDSIVTAYSKKKGGSA